MKRNWDELTATSYTDTVAELQATLEEKDYEQVAEGLQTLFSSISQELKRALRSQLSRLMMHIIKWKIQPEKRSGSWAVSILDARENIEEIMAEKPSLNQQYLAEIWEKTFAQATRKAEEETQQSSKLDRLTWQEVFDDEYSILKK
ncbi:DUF29 family protein [Larkinella rosea]|uniref:DUF29 family protein n=1 Tax=Larkinella rosea TaxID=2025312 RepID=A0A3P1C0C3_9BACT|nr:DUF29 family protein [Larkinella rosea]RRB06503.1 DUF29 family protein [Larkinella rosea]